MKLQAFAIAAIATVPLAAIGTIPARAQFISAILGPVLSAWIESEVESVDNLSVRVTGNDNDILDGTIDRAEIAGDNLTYNGFYITRIELDGENIQLNANEALQGESLRLTQPLPVAALMRWSEVDLNRSLQAPLLRSQLSQAEVELPIGAGTVAFQIREPQVSLQENRLQIDALLDTPEAAEIPIRLATSLRTGGANEVILVDPVWLTGETVTPIAGLAGLALDLGPDVSVDDLRLAEGELIYRGTVTVHP